MLSSITCASVTEHPYLLASRPAYFPCSALLGGADTSSSKLRQISSTSSRCAKRAKAASNRRLPIKHHGKTTSDQTSTFKLTTEPTPSVTSLFPAACTPAHAIT